MRCKAGTTRRNSHFHQDNPAVSGQPGGEEWLRDNPTAVTGWYHGVSLNPGTLLDLPGKMGEEVRINQEKLAVLAESMREHGWLAGDPPLIIVEHDGRPFIYEGNHRIRAAVRAGIDDIEVDVRYLGGAETMTGVFNPEAD